MIMPLAKLQKMTSLEGNVTAIHVRLKAALAGKSADDDRLAPDSRPHCPGFGSPRHPSVPATINSSCWRMRRLGARRQGVSCRRMD
jgi:hypothetical protein